MKALVTGANGFIGSHLVRELLKKKAEVRAFIKPGTQTKTLEGLDIEILKGNICNPADLVSASQGCEEVYHLAAYNRLWTRDPSIYERVNYRGSINVFEAALKNGVRRVLHTSTCDHLGIDQRKNGECGSEENYPATIRHLGPYSRSKWMVNQAVSKYINQGLECVIVNPTIPVGSLDTYPTEIGKVIRNFLSGSLHGYVKREMNFVDVKDCVKGFVLAMKKGISGERYILGGDNMNLRDFLERVAQYSGKPMPKFAVPYCMIGIASYFMEAYARWMGTEPQSSREGAALVKYSFCFSSQKAQDHLGYTFHSLNRAVEEAVDWHSCYTFRHEDGDKSK